MKIWFCETPGEKATGGLDAAIRSLESHLIADGIEVISTRELPEPFPEFDLVHFHGLWQPWHSSLSKALRDNGRPYLISPHGMLEPWAWKHKRYKKIPYFFLRERKHLAGANCILATAAMEQKNLQEAIPNVRVEAIPLGLTGDARPDYTQARTKLGWSDGRKVLLFLSRVHEKKGLDLLLQALEGMQIMSFCRVVIVGGGDSEYVEKLQRYTEQHRARLPEIEWVGEVWGDDKWKYLQGADLFCLPTHSENFGLVVLEAVQVGTRVMTTDQTPWKDLLEPGKHWIIQPEIESIQHALVSYFKQSEWTDTQRLELAGWAGTHFGWSTIIAQYKALYHSLRTGSR